MSYRKKCGWWNDHCFHKVDGTEQKVKRTNVKKCSLEHDYIYDGLWGKRIDIVAKMKCCWCNKERQTQMLDFDITRAINYPEYKGEE